MGPGTILVAAVAFGVIVLISKSIRVVQQAQTMIIERLGKYHKTLTSGINFVLPVIDRPRSVDWHQTIITPAGDSYSRRFRLGVQDLGLLVALRGVDLRLPNALGGENA